MTDVFSAAKRSWLMARVRSKDTRPEKAVRSCLHANGFRFRLHPVSLPGKPDIVLPRYRTAIFVHGCFWHCHRTCRKGRQRPETNEVFWAKKLAMNVLRDKRARQELRKQGWSVLVLWECQIVSYEKLVKALSPLFETRSSLSA